MAKDPRIVRLSLDEALRESERQATSMSLPLAVHHRLDLLARAAKYVEASRAEVVGMLIANAPLDAEELEPAVLRYRKLTVGDVVPDEQPEVTRADEPADAENVISIARRRPGRPSR